jgi:hypothetical protein
MPNQIQCDTQVYTEVVGWYVMFKIEVRILEKKLLGHVDIDKLVHTQVNYSQVGLFVSTRSLSSQV